MPLKIIPMTLSQANELVRLLHRHHMPTVGHRWSIGCIDGERICGAAICGRPVARLTDQYKILEVNRLVTDGTKNACSMLYGRCARIAREMGFDLIQTAILDSEPATSLKAAGWTFDRIVKGRNWNCPSRGGRRTDQPMCDKQIWVKVLCQGAKVVVV